ncbi:hypothetical protein CSB37_03020 [bacterium DOLZORAL124_38_8]|nr:MAG: hypothetical protein CSB37_03020 [bacterium DOLZORAL124_38_8]
MLLKMKKIILVLLVIATVYTGARIHSTWTTPNSDITTRVNFEIKKGSSLKTISKVLENKGLIQDAWSFRQFSWWHNLSTKFQAGEYVAQKNLTFREVAELLQNGKSTEIKVTIPEGYTIHQIDALLAKKNLIKLNDFVKCANQCPLPFALDNLEGYLFPSTYYVNQKNFQSKAFLIRLHKTFLQQIKPFRADIKSSGRSLKDIVKVASMIEREAFGDSLEEKKQIAGVIWKRLDIRMHLGIDATTRYELNEWKRPLYAEDFATASPYNMRKTLGLPPTAISNFSLDSFKAALYPIDTGNLYYLHGCRGKIYFGKTHEEHIQNKQYLCR